MMQLHIPTLLIMIILACVTLAVSVIVASDRKTGDGLREWGVALCAHAGGYILLALRGMVPDFISIVLANVFISISYSIFLFAVHIFLGTRASAKSIYWGPPCFLAIAITLVLNNVGARVAIGHLVFLAQGLVVVIRLLRHRYDFSLRGRNLLLFGLTTATLVTLWKAGVALAAPETLGTFYNPTPVQTLMYLAAFISVMIVSSGFSLMAKERSDAFLHTVAVQDRLTGCWNRVRIEEIIRQELERLKRYGHPASILMLDLDNFKQVNDRHGHMIGDAVLRDFGSMLRHTIRATDVAGRWGGEEFIVVMPFSSFSDAVRIAERIRQALERQKFPQGVEVTTSIGISGCRSADSWESWLCRADAALYKAKTSGRNQVKIEELEGDPKEFVNAETNIGKIFWTQEYECGHKLIDAQHQALIARLNDVLQFSAGHSDRAAVLEKLKDLFRHTSEHFDNEEKILFEKGYKDLSAHADSHRYLTERANRLLGMFEADKVDLAALFHFIAYELTAQHILLEDQQFRNVFRADKRDAASGDPKESQPAARGGSGT